MKPRPRVSEKVEQAHVVQLFRSIGGRAYVLGTRRRGTDYQGTMQSPGTPDVIAWAPPLASPELVFIECKAAGGRLRPEQREFLELCVRAGVAHIVGGLDAAIAWLAARGHVRVDQFPHYRHPHTKGAKHHAS